MRRTTGMVMPVLMAACALLVTADSAYALRLGRIGRLIDDFKENPVETGLILGACIAIAAAWMWWKNRSRQKAQS